MPENESLKVEDVTELLQLSRNTVYSMARSGELPSYKIGRKLRFRYSDIVNYIETRRQGGEIGVTTANPEVASAIPGSFKLAGDDISGDVIASMLSRSNIPVASRRSSGYDALIDLYRGDIDIACVHLYDLRTNSYNVPFVQRLAPGLPVRVFRLVRRRQGLAVAKGNPKHISTWGGLLKEGVRIANQPKGTGGRVLLDEKLLSLEANPAVIAGYSDTYASDIAAINAVASGHADATITSEQVAGDYKAVDFIPMQSEWVDIAVRKCDGTRPLLRQLRSVMESSVLQGMLKGAGDVDTGQLGAIIYEC